MEDLGIPCEIHISSAHRTPGKTKKLIENAVSLSCKVFITAAGMAAHLAGAIAAHTIKPVIGVPLTSNASSLQGVDALLSTVQIPSGMPVATVAINGAKNAAWLAAQILASEDEELETKISEARKKASLKISEKDDELQKDLYLDN